MSIGTIALGTMQFLWTTSEPESYRILDTYYDLGGRQIDTADVYTNWANGLSGGEAETILGKWMVRTKRRDQIFLMSKVGGRMWEGSDGAGLSHVHIEKAIDATLQRLRTDYLDVYFVHFPDHSTPIEETIEVMSTLIKRGKTRFVGLCNYSPEELERIVSMDDKKIFTYIQAYYNLVDREHFEKKLRPIIEKFHLTPFIYGPLAGGFLSGAYRNNKSLPTHARAPMVADMMTEKNMRLLLRLDELAKRYGSTASQISLAWLLNQKLNPIIGADIGDQVIENMNAQSIRLSPEDDAFLSVR